VAAAQIKMCAGGFSLQPGASKATPSNAASA
jgi:hypothetical protein